MPSKSRSREPRLSVVPSNQPSETPSLSSVPSKSPSREPSLSAVPSIQPSETPSLCPSCGDVSAEKDRTETEELKAENERLVSFLVEYQRKLIELQATVEMERKDALTEFVIFKERSDALLVAIFKEHEGEVLYEKDTIAPIRVSTASI